MKRERAQVSLKISSFVFRKWTTILGIHCVIFFKFWAEFWISHFFDLCDSFLSRPNLSFVVRLFCRASTSDHPTSSQMVRLISDMSYILVWLDTETYAKAFLYKADKLIYFSSPTMHYMIIWVRRVLFLGFTMFYLTENYVSQECIAYASVHDFGQILTWKWPA